MPAHSSNLGGFDWLDAPSTQPFAGNIKGTAGSDLLTAPDNQDYIFTGKGGGDTMLGGAGDDLFRDGPGSDSIVGGGGFDRLSFGFYTSWAHGAYANLATGVVIDGDGNTDHVSGISWLGGGTLYADTFIGGSTPNAFLGGLGDVLVGGAQDNVFMILDTPASVTGGGGVNTLYFLGGRWLAPDPNDQSQFPQLTPEAATRGVNVNLGTGQILDDGFGNSGQIENIQNVVGGPMDDVIIGDKGDNVLSGEGGNDTLTGGGGGGHDVFLFDSHAYDWNANPIANGHDVITDFNRGHDKIDINIAGVTGMADLNIFQDAAGNVVISYGPNDDTITLLHVHHVNAGDFIFGPI